MKLGLAVGAVALAAASALGFAGTPSALADPVTGHRAVGNQDAAANTIDTSIGFGNICPTDQPLPVSATAYGYEGTFSISSERWLYAEISPNTGSDNSVSVDIPAHSSTMHVHLVVFCAAV